MSEFIGHNTTLVILGGDCGILLGIIGAFIKVGEKIGLVMLDGHTDFRSPESSPSGEAADLPLWILTGRGPLELSNLYGHTPVLEDSEITVFGYREPDMIEQSSINRFNWQQMARLGISKAVTLGLQPLFDQGLDLWLHFDVDAIDPVEMPAVHFPEPGGLSINEATDLIKQVLKTERVLGISLGCYHNNNDTNGVAGARLARLIAEVLI